MRITFTTTVYLVLYLSIPLTKPILFFCVQCRETENGDLKRLSNLPTTDMDSEQTVTLRSHNLLLLENPARKSGPPVSPRQSKPISVDDSFYDSVPQEENISYIDGNNQFEDVLQSRIFE